MAVRVNRLISAVATRPGSGRRPHGMVDKQWIYACWTLLINQSLIGCTMHTMI